MPVNCLPATTNLATGMEFADGQQLVACLAVQCRLLHGAKNASICSNVRPWMTAAKQLNPVAEKRRRAVRNLENSVADRLTTSR